MSKRFRKFLYAFLTLAILCAAGIAVLSTPWFHRVVERHVTARLQELTGARVEIGEMRFNPVILQITFHRLVLHGAERPPQAPLFSARTVVVRLNPLSIARRRLLLARLDLNGAEAHLVTQPDGSSNLPGPRVAGETPSDRALGELLDLSIGRLTLSHTDVYWNQQRLPLELSARNVAVQMRRGAAHHYQGSLSSGALKVDAPGFSLPAVTMTSRFDISQSEINVTSLAWHGEGFSGQSSLQMKMAPQPEVRVSFKANGAAAEVSRMVKLGRVESGNARVEGQATYERGAWQAQGQIQGRQILVSSRSFNPGRIDFDADYSAEKGRIRLPNLRVSALGGTLQGRGEISLQNGTPQLTLHAELRGLRFGTALASLAGGHPLLNSLHWDAAMGGITDASWTGRFENLNSHFSLQLQSRPGASASALPVSGQVRGSVTNAQGLTLKLDAVEIRTPHSTLTARGTMKASQSQLAVNLVTNNFEEWRAPVEFLARATEPIPLELKDPATFSGTLSGTEIRPAIHGRLSAGMFDYRGWRWDELEAEVDAAPDSVEISAGRLRSGQSVLNVAASARLEDWQLDPNGPARFAARAERTPLEGLKAALGVGYPFGGLATGRLELKGTASRLTGGGTLRVDQGTLAGRPFDTFTADLQVAESVWTMENIQLSRGQARVTGRGSFEPVRRAFSAELHGGDISLSELEPNSPSHSGRGGAHRLEGRLGFDLQGQGTLENVELHAGWDVQDLMVMGMPAGNVRGQLNWQDRKLQFSGESAGAGGTLHFSGDAQTEGDWPVDFSGEYSDFRVGPWIRFWLNSKLDALVTASGSARMTGPLRKPNELEVRSQLRTLEVNASGLTWTNVQPVELRYAGGVLSASRFRVQGPSTNLQAEGSMRFGEQASLVLTAQGESDATLLSLLDPAVKATGRSKVDLRVNGTPAHPLLFGALEVEDLNLSYGDFPFHLFGMNGEIRLEGERASVRSLRGLSGGGSVTIQGFMTFAERPRFELRANVDQVRVQYPAEFTSQLSGTLRLTGTSENSLLDGDLSVRQLFASPNFNVLNLVSEVGSTAGTPAIGVASPIASRIRMNVQASSAPTVRLETQDLRLVADVDLRLQGTLGNPVVVGSIHVLNGETVIRGNRYKVNRADISMTNPFRTQPLLDLEATTRVERYDLTLDVSGPLDQIKIAYRSDPPLPTSDILSLLALGYSRRQGELPTTGEEHFSTVGASALLSEALSSPMTGRIQRLFGVSRIKIDPNVGGLENAAGARVTVEQQVTRELTLTYITDTAGSQRRVIQFEWTVSDSVSLLGVRDRNGIFGVEVKFRRRFK